MDFNAYMACCTANYQRMHKLLPSSHPIGECLTWAMGKMGQLQIQLINKQSHTDTLNIEYRNNQFSQWLADFEVQVKLYHDAALAEVTALKDSKGNMQFFSHPKIHKQYPYWEKWQMNHLLCDVLGFCLKHPN